MLSGQCTMGVCTKVSVRSPKASSSPVLTGMRSKPSP